jgi:hypothetical protein
VNLDAVREFARTSSEAVSYEALVEDYVDAPQRRAVLQPRTATIEESRFQDRVAQRTELLELHAALSDYMQVLGQLAGDEPPHLQQTRAARDLRRARRSRDREPAQTGRERATPLDTSDLQAVRATFGKVSEALLGAWRQAEVERLLLSGGDDFEAVLLALRDRVLPLLADDAEAELIAVDKHYRGLLAPLASQEDELSLAAVALLRRQQAVQAAEVHGRQHAIEDYASILDEILAGHRALRDGCALDNSALAAELRDRARAILGLTRELDRHPRPTATR